MVFSTQRFCHFRYNEDLELEDAIHTAILTLKVKYAWTKHVFIINSINSLRYLCVILVNVNLLQESFEGQMTEDNIEVGICNESGFKRLTPAEVKDYLAAIA